MPRTSTSHATSTRERTPRSAVARGARSLLAMLLPPASAGSWHRAVELASFGVGSALCSSWLQSIAGPAAPIAAGGLFLLGYFGSQRLRSRPLRWGLVALLAASHAAFFYVAAAFGVLLAWTVPPAIVALALALLALSVAGPFVPRLPKIALCLPLGLWTAAVLVGWLREDGLIRCDDYLELERHPDTSLVIPTSIELAGCAPGEELRVHRYPRHLWQTRDGAHLFFTTQPGESRFSPRGRAARDRLDGSVCEAPLDGSRRPECVGTGKAQAFAESDRHDRLFVGAWGRIADGSHGAVYAVARRPPLRLLAERHFEQRTGELYYDERTDMLGLLSDEGEVVLPVSGADLTPRDPIVAPIIPGETRYDPARGEGVFCFSAGPLKPLDGSGYAAVAFRGAPFAARPLAPSDRHPSSWLALSWGCDWDSRARRVYVGVANLGLLLTIDYDSGDVLDRNFVGLGVRSIALHPSGERLYFADFLRGRVHEWDLTSGRETRSWFVGRFVRYVLVARDGRSLMASSTLGVVQIRI